MPVRSVNSLLETGRLLQDELRSFKAANHVPDYGWYPYDSLSALPIAAGLLALHSDAVDESLRRHPVADLGCADGDWSVLFARLGAEVDAVDHAESNFNQLRGLELLRNHMAPPVTITDLDLDARFELPRSDYGLILFMGTLYHLKNPYYVLEKLAAAGDWCVLSTRIARRTAHTGVAIDSEPLAYLLNPREANHDPTNFWIFSHAGLMRLLERTGWMVEAQTRVGCTEASNPVDPQRDERIFVLLRSRTRHPELLVRPLEGWHAVEGTWRWTSKHFALEVALPLHELAREFALRFTVPEVVAGAGQVRLVCRSENTTLGSITCHQAGTIEFRGRFPENTPAGSVLRLHFAVESAYAPENDARELGVIVPVTGRDSGVPFRIS